MTQKSARHTPHLEEVKRRLISRITTALTTAVAVLWLLLVGTSSDICTSKQNDAAFAARR